MFSRKFVWMTQSSSPVCCSLPRSRRPLIGLRDCVNGPFLLRHSAWLRENEKIIAWLRETDMCAWCVKGLFGVRDGVKSPFSFALFAWLREIGKNMCVIAWKWKNVTSLYDCVKAGKYVRDGVKMEKNLRDCVIGHPPWGAGGSSRLF